MDIEQDPYFIFNRKVMSMVGLWPTQTHKERFLRYFVIGFMLWYSVLAQLCQLFTLDFDLGSIVAFLQCFIPLSCTVHVYFSFVPHVVKIRGIISNMIQDWKLLNDDVEIQIMKRCINECKLFTIACAFMFYLYIIVVISPSVIRICLFTNEVTSSRDHYPIFSCFDYFLERETYYYPLVFYQIFTNLLSPAVAITCYNTYLWFILHLRAQLSIIKRKIHRPFENRDHNDRVLEEPMDLTYWIIDIVILIDRTFYERYTATMNALAEKPYFFQTSIGFMILVIDFLCLFQLPVLLEHETDGTKIFSYLSFVVGTICPIYLNFYIGQRLMDDSMDVYKEACLIPFHEISPKTQKLLLTTLTMYSTPCAISIGKVFVSSHEFFSNLIRGALSFAMILHSTQQSSI